MQNEKESIIKILWAQGAIQFGEFDLKSTKKLKIEMESQPIRCPKCKLLGMGIEINGPFETYYGDEKTPYFTVNFVCNNVVCSYIMSGNVYEP